jgi:hypothetical protein
MREEEEEEEAGVVDSVRRARELTIDAEMRRMEVEVTPDPPPMQNEHYSQ